MFTYRLKSFVRWIGVLCVFVCAVCTSNSTRDGFTEDSVDSHFQPLETSANNSAIEWFPQTDWNGENMKREKKRRPHRSWTTITMIHLSGKQHRSLIYLIMWRFVHRNDHRKHMFAMPLAQRQTNANRSKDGKADTYQKTTANKVQSTMVTSK